MSLFSGFGGYAQPLGSAGPYDANSTQWLQAASESNSTGVFNIPGYDVSQSWPGKSIDGWTLSVEAMDVDSGSVEIIGSTEIDHRLVGYSMSIKAPDSLIKQDKHGNKIVDVNPSWGMCIWNWESPEYGNFSLYNNRDNKPLATDGSCTGFLSDACIAALEKSAETAYDLYDKPLGAYGSRVSCSEFFDTPAECNGTVGGSTLALSSLVGVPIQYLNGSVTFQDGWDIDQNTTAQDLKDMWDSMVVNFWPILTLFVDVTNDTSSLDVKPGLANLSCIAPDGVGTGKVFTYSDRTGYKKSDGNVATVPLGWTLCIAFTLVVLFGAI